MSEESPDRRDPVDEPGLVEALHVKRNLAVAGVLGVVIASVVFAGRITEALGPAPDQGSPALFFGLAIVLASAIAALVGFVLIAVSAIRLARAGVPENGDAHR